MSPHDFARVGHIQVTSLLNIVITKIGFIPNNSRYNIFNYIPHNKSINLSTLTFIISLVFIIF